jgi:putative phosphoribosyl transferase
MKHRFRDRTEAGQQLATQLATYADAPDVIVLGLPRGGVPVAYEIAQALHVPLDICLVRKLGVPDQPELAMGAIAPGGIMVVNQEILRSLKISREDLLAVAEQEQQELERREQAYRGDRPLPQIGGHTVILVDDGIATSSTVRAAVASLRQQQPKALVIATPVAPPETVQALSELVDQVVCLIMPESLVSISQWYVDFAQTSDEEVRLLLSQSTYPQSKTVSV